MYGKDFREPHNSHRIQARQLRAWTHVIFMDFEGAAKEEESISQD